MKKGAGVGVRNAMEGCYAAASNKTEKLACRQGPAPAPGGRRSSTASGPVAVALAKSLGKESVEKSDVEEYVRASARERTAFTMKSCIDASADTDAARNACRDTTVKKTIAESMGLEDADVDATSIREFVKRGAEASAAETMSDCMEDAGTVDSKIAACKTTAKSMAAKAAGKSTVTETEFIEMKKKGAAKEAQDALSSCVDGAGTDAARTACINGPSGSRRGLADSPLTKAIAKALGKKATEVDITDCLLYTSPSPRDRTRSRMPSSA